MVLRVEREVPLSPTLLTALREYYRWMRLRGRTHDTHASSMIGLGRCADLAVP